MLIKIGDLLECVTDTVLMMPDFSISSTVITRKGDQLLVVGINGDGLLPITASGRNDHDVSDYNWLRVIVGCQTMLLDWRFMVPYEIFVETDYDGEDDDDREVSVVDNPNFKLIQHDNL